MSYVEYYDPDTGAALSSVESAAVFAKKAIAEAAKHVILNPDSFRHLPFQTPEICMAAVMRDGMQLQYVEKQTPEICLAATEQNFQAFQFVEDQSNAVCVLAMEADERILSFIRDEDTRDEMTDIHPLTGQVPERKEPDNFAVKIVAEAVKRTILDPRLFFHMPFTTPETRMASVMKDGSLICVIDKNDQTPALRAAAVRQTWEGLEGVEVQNPAIIELAINADVRAVTGIRHENTRDRYIFHLFEAKGLAVPKDIEKTVMEVLNSEGAPAPGGPHA